MPNSLRLFVKACSSFSTLSPPEGQRSPCQSSLHHSPAAGGPGSTLFPWPAVTDLRKFRQRPLPRGGPLGVLLNATSDGLPSWAERGVKGGLRNAGENNRLPPLCLERAHPRAKAPFPRGFLDYFLRDICKGVQRKKVPHCFSGKDGMKKCFWRKWVTASFCKAALAL